MKPGFVALFERGRYCRRRDDERHLQQERFTAAAIGFCIQQDEQFARVFWNKICQGDGDPPAGIVHCDVEPEHWADLVVFNQTQNGEMACVVELKLDKPLSDHQNPANAAFSSESGYGKLVVDDKAVLGNLPRRYVVLGAMPEPDLPATHGTTGLSLDQRQWADLERVLPESPLCNDFAQLLQSFEVAAFRYRLTKNMKVTNSLAEAAKAHALIQDTAASLGFRINPKSWDIRAHDPSQPGYWCYGVGIEMKTAGQQGDLFLRLLGDRAGAEWAAWMGYESDGKEGFDLLVELYPSSSAAPAVQQMLTKKADATGWRCNVAHEGEPRTIRIRGTPPVEISDSDWFQSVFHAVGIHG